MIYKKNNLFKQKKIHLNFFYLTTMYYRWLYYVLFDNKFEA